MPGEGENFEMGGSSLSLKATSESTDGGFFLSETTVEPGLAGPPLHIHHELTDMFYVLEGVLTSRIGEDTVEGPPGTFICAARTADRRIRRRSARSPRATTSSWLDRRGPAGRRRSRPPGLPLELVGMRRESASKCGMFAAMSGRDQAEAVRRG